MATKRKHGDMAPEADDPIDPADELMFLCLGGGNEVGRSCHILQYKGKTIMLDAGMHPAYEGLSAMPFWDEFDISTVDILLISHFHLDHAASLPYVLAKTNFRGRVFMTHPTKAIYKWLIADSVRIGNMSSTAENRVQLYNESDHLSTFPQIEAIDFYTTHTISSVRITPYPAGHVLGAAMFLVEIAGLNILFTGDYSREEDRHLVSATVPPSLHVDVLITESTYGIATHQPRQEREFNLMRAITNSLNKGGRCLLPVFALGRAQEILLILDEYWSKHPEYQKIPIYYASGLARKCMIVYQTYISAMNDNIRNLFRTRMAEAEAKGDAAEKNGPWDFRYVRSLKSMDRFDDVGSCVMLATPGMMQSGISRELLERWAPDPKNAVIMTGYSVEGTMGKIIMTEPESISAIMTKNTAQGAGKVRGLKAGEDRVQIPRRCEVSEYSFAAHVDGTQNREFIEEVKADVVILVHGERNQMTRLKSKLLSLNATRPTPMKVFSPANCEELRIPFRTDKVAKVVGKLAQIPIPSVPNSSFEEDDDENINGGPVQDTRMVSGVLVQNDFKLSLMAPEDLREYAGLNTTIITLKQRLRLAAATPELIKWALEGVFGSIQTISSPGIKAAKGESKTNGDTEMNGNGVTIKKEEDTDMEKADEEIPREDETTFKVMDAINVTCRAQGEVEVEWEGNMVNDALADAILAILFTVETSKAAVRLSSSTHKHTSDEETSTPPPTLSLANKKHPHANLTPEEKFTQFCWFLEAQFGEDITTINFPRPPKSSDNTAITDSPAPTPSTTPPSPITRPTSDPSQNDPSALTPQQARELKRLHSVGVPVPGVYIRHAEPVDDGNGGAKVDEKGEKEMKILLEATVWLEDLEVECVNKIFRERVKRVVERAVEAVSPIWG
ncbi:metallo-beta-lactamase superfamily protein [Aulographum hederae CBS 113979]|uniref:Metallo-beta-lactamase superfamily protein n=1 Tax=Aulographum hederae CBS 113979 TaxID=1176131 RepID=A0A6G1GW87_9PEZI|nr:metallo-beta-lactamase superfamily protein [Aulographum hederae CBS 113979]